MRACKPSHLKLASIHRAADTVLYDNQWLQLKDIDGYVYSHEKRCNGNIVVILPHRRIGKDGWEFLIREEVTPCWVPGPTRSAMTGGVESTDPAVDALRELKEEAGYTVSQDQMIPLGKCRGSKSSDTYYHLFTVDLANQTPGVAAGDGSKGDKAPPVWVSADAIAQLEDAMAMVAYVRARKLGIY